MFLSISKNLLKLNFRITELYFEKIMNVILYKPFIDTMIHDFANDEIR